MLKKLLFAFVALAIATVVSAQTQQRRVLVEEFTNASCPPCASQNPGFNATLQANYDLVTAIKYQTNWPGVDPMNAQNPTEVGTRVTYYGVSGVPHAVVNGVDVANDCNAYPGAPACLSGTEITNANANLTPVSISMTHSYSSTFDTIFVQISVTSETALSGNLRLRAAITEEEIFFDAAPGTNGEKEFFQVMRKMLPNAAGTVTGDFAAGETKTYSFAWKPTYAYDLNELGAVAWLQNDDTQEVWQSQRSLPAGGIPAAGVSVPSYNAFACLPGYQPKVTLNNIGTNPLTSVNLRWRVGNGVWKDYAWTGNIASGASGEVTLDTAFNATGTYKVEVQVLNSNNGIQTNLVGALSTLQVRALLDAPSALPFSHGFQTGSVPPPGWTLANVVSGTATNGWKLFTSAGSGSSRCTRCNFFDFATGNAVLTTPKMDMSAANGVTTLNFDHAYAYYNATFFDSLRIQVSNDCGETWATIFHDGYEGLATTTPQAGTAGWAPAAGDWVSNSIDISAFNGSAELLVRFIGESGYGNNLYVDNINVTSLVGVKELQLSNFSLRPNPTSDVAQIRFGLEKPESIHLSVYSSTGQLMQSRNLGDLTSGEHTITLDANSLPSGNYRVVLQGKEGVANAQWVVVK